MNAIERAIKEAAGKGEYRWSSLRVLAVERLAGDPRGFVLSIGSEKSKYKTRVPIAEIFLDPLFWQALGKARGWETGQCDIERCSIHCVWLREWHVFIDHLAEGKDAESFFETLLGNAQ